MERQFGACWERVCVLLLGRWGRRACGAVVNDGLESWKIEEGRRRT